MTTSHQTMKSSNTTHLSPTKTWIGIALICILIGVAGIFIYGTEDKNLVDFRQRWTFSSSDPLKLTIDNSDDLIVQFVTSPDGQGYINLAGKVKQEVSRQLQEARIEQGALTLSTVPKTNISFFSIHQNTKKTITVALPNGANLQSLTIQGNSSEVKLQDAMVHTTSFNLTSGDIEIVNLHGEHLSVDTVSGDVTAKGVHSDTNFNTQLGDVILSDYSGNSTLRVTSGDIKITQQIAGNLDIKSTHGDTNIKVAPDFSGLYDARTTSGVVDTPNSTGGGTHTVKIRTTSGDIHITQ